jgi:hypothetical protein
MQQSAFGKVDAAETQGSSRHNPAAAGCAHSAVIATARCRKILSDGEKMLALTRNIHLSESVKMTDDGLSSDCAGVRLRFGVE